MRRKKLKNKNQMKQTYLKASENEKNIKFQNSVLTTHHSGITLIALVVTKLVPTA